MSRITKFLRQTCKLASVATDSKGNYKYNDFGEPTYSAAKTIRCRKEQLSQTVQTAEGELVTSTTRYYVDGSVTVKVEDKLDDCVVVSVSSLTNERGQVEGYECYV